MIHNFILTEKHIVKYQQMCHILNVRAFIEEKEDRI